MSEEGQIIKDFTPLFIFIDKWFLIIYNHIILKGITNEDK